jgi:A/G-specific adenine glycosylase
MDYGTYLKQTTGNASRRSAHYAKQSRFEGSKRQIRGQVLRLLGQEPQSASMLREAVSDDRLETVLEDLLLEGFIEQQDGLLKLRDL